jgi:hypothetical protein
METPDLLERAKGRRDRSPGYRWGVASRVVAASAGGYLLAASSSVALALASGRPAGEGAHLGILPSFLVWTGAVVWAFSARTAARAWLGVIAPALLVAVVILMQTGSQ